MRDESRDTQQDRILFISVPETLRGNVSGLAGGDDGDGFCIDPDIPLPVEMQEGATSAKAVLEDLSWEMIVSGMLRVIAASELEADRIDYYRGFVLAVRPTIMGEFTEAAILKARNGEFGLAMEILDSLRGLFPGSPAVRLNRALVMEQRADLLERQGKPEAEAAFRDAETAYTEAMSMQPAFAEAWFNAGFFFLGRKDFSRARECFSLYAEDSDSAFDEPRDDAKTRRARDLIKEIDASGLEDESFREAYMLVREGKEEAGMQSIRGFIERQPDVWNGWFVLGWALRRLGRWSDAAAAFGRAMELGGGNSDTRNELAICLMETGDLKGARHQLESALHDDCENVKIISNLGVLALKAGNESEATAFFRTVLDLDPDDQVAE
ncbi:MAG: tetratricopeptide repeat protein, partial [Treponema sp.]|nr:tetratricopeptide repeat protein [Treponema sp.]